VALGETIPSASSLARVEELLERRGEANRAFFEAEAERLARCCHAMAERFAAGGRLIAIGAGPAARSDARHVAVEFVHPVIVGKRALPALALAAEGGPLAAQLEALAEPGDIAIGFGAGEPGGEPAAGALELARARGCLTIAFAAAGAEWEFAPPGDDPFVGQELVETLYHVLWELVHVFFEHRGVLAAGPSAVDAGAGFLYPFLSGGEREDLERVIDDVRASVLVKAGEVGELREQTLRENAATLVAAAIELRRTFEGGGKLLAFGNGGSATDAMDLVADLRYPPAERAWPSRAAIDLTEDSSILTAIANDIGPAEIFQRQVIAYGGEGDAALAFSTSGGSENLITALAEARRRGLATIALCGYDGGRIAAEDLADHVIVSRSQHIPRIQEAQASAYHVLRELVEPAGEAGAR
jgi:D-sedoheptulose 7-phosphate isomerase